MSRKRNIGDGGGRKETELGDGRGGITTVSFFFSFLTFRNSQEYVCRGATKEESHEGAGESPSVLSIAAASLLLFLLRPSPGEAIYQRGDGRRSRGEVEAVSGIERGGGSLRKCNEHVKQKLKEQESGKRDFFNPRRLFPKAPVTQRLLEREEGGVFRAIYRTS